METSPLPSNFLADAALGEETSPLPSDFLADA